MTVLCGGAPAAALAAAQAAELAARLRSRTELAGSHVIPMENGTIFFLVRVFFFVILSWFIFACFFGTNCPMFFLLELEFLSQDAGEPRRLDLNSWPASI